MSQMIATNAHYRLPVEIWMEIRKFADLPTLYNMMKADERLGGSYDLFISQVIKSLKSEFPNIDTDTKVSIERLIELPSTQELLNRGGIDDAIFLSHIKKGINNTLSLWKCTDYNGVYIQDVAIKAIPLLEANNIDLHGIGGGYGDPLLYAITQRYSPNGRGNSPFAREGAHLIQKLIDAGVDMNARNAYGETVLHLAASFGSNMNETRGYEGNSEPILITLIENGADLNALTTRAFGCSRNVVNSTPLHWALRTDDNMKCGIYNAEILLDHLANPLLPDSNGDTPFSIAINNWRHDKTSEHYNDTWHSARLVEKACNAIIAIDELVEPQQVWEAYDNTEYLISGDALHASSDVS